MHGGKRRLPKRGNVDILIAGFPCVDLSNLNAERGTRSKWFEGSTQEALAQGWYALTREFGDISHIEVPEEIFSSLVLTTSEKDGDTGRQSKKAKKTDKDGVSGNAFLAIFRYVDEYRPTIVLLENLNSAPWETLKRVFAAIDYSANYVRVNTRDYYLPQVRTRGYMFCINNNVFKGQKGLRLEEARSKADEWCTLMKSFKRPASSSAEEFLLDPDHPALQKALKALSRTGEHISETRAIVDWSVCEGRHHRYRKDRALGQGVPYTKWSRGALTPPGYAHKEWIRMQSSRVQDCLDMVALENAKKADDIQYKFHVADVSQNIDRGLEPSAPGVVGCITPSGCPFFSLRGAPITGLEALTLQGLPLERVLFAQEKDSQLRDLAGNAMSSTVIGAAILAAIMVGKDALTRQPLRNKEPEQGALAQLPDIDPRLQVASFSSAPIISPRSLSFLLRAAESCRINCECERLSNAPPPPLSECEECMTLMCSKCAGNPLHAQPLHRSRHRRQRPHHFTSLISNALPASLVLDISMKDFLAATGPTRFGRNEKTHYYFLAALSQSLGQELYLKSIKRSTYWFVVYESEGQLLRLSLRPNGAEWQLFVKALDQEPGNSEVRLLLSRPVAKCKLRDENSTNLLAGHWKIRLPTYNQISGMVTGCGRSVPSWKARLGLVDFNEERIWDEILLTSNDVITETRAESIFGNYNLLPNCGTANGTLHKKVVQHGADEPHEPLYLFLDPSRFGNPNADIFVISNNHQRLGYKEYRGELAHVTLPASNTKLEYPNWAMDKAQQYSVDESQGRAYIREIPNLTRKKKKKTRSKTSELPTTPQWRPSMEAEQLVQINVFDIWVPSKALLRIPSESHSILSLASGISGSTFDKGPTSTCQDALTVILQCEIPWFGRNPDGRSSNHGCTVTEGNQMGMKLDIYWLAKKVGPLVKDASKWMAIALGDVGKACDTCTPPRPRLSWRVAQVELRKRMRNLFIPSVDPHAASSFETLLRDRPSPFSLDLLPLSPLTDHRTLTIAVRPHVLVHRAIFRLCKTRSGVKTGPVKASWRIVPDEPHEILKPTKYAIPPIGNKHSQSFRFPATKYKLRSDQERSLHWMTVRDRVDPPPFQEMMVEESISFHLGWNFEAKVTRECSTRGGILADDVGFGKTITTLALILSTLKDSPKHSNTSGPFVLTNATLIVAPDSLVGQWATEIRKFCPQSISLTINSLRDLRDITVSAMRSADIVLISVSLFDYAKSPHYVDFVADFAAFGKPPTKAALARYSAWWKLAMGKVKLTMASLAAHSRSKLPLHAYHFKRKVIDEQSYLKSSETTSIRAIQSTSTWILSATLKLQGFHDVQKLASLLGVHLTMPEPSRSNTRRGASKKNEHEKARAHAFQTSHGVHSQPCNIKLHLMAQRFLSFFARSNTPDIRPITTEITVAPVALQQLHETIYLELQADLLSGNAKYQKPGPNERFFNHDRRNRLMHVMSLSRSFGEALQKAIYCLPAPDHMHPMSMKLLTDADLTWDLLLSAREADIDRFKLLILKELAFINVFRLATSDKKHEVVKPSLKFQVAVDRAKAVFEDDPGPRLGDVLVTTIFRALKSQITNGKHGVDLPDEVAAEDARKRVDNLTRLGKSLTASVRAVRYLRSMHAIQNDSIADLSKARGLRFGSRCQCDLTTQKDFAINQQCGHIICGSCYETGSKGDRCSEDCDAKVSRVSYLTDKHIRASAYQKTVSHSTKQSAIVDFMKSTRESEQILIFCQLKDVADVLFAEVKKEGFEIKAPKSKDAAKVLSDFRSIKFGGRGWFKVLMLDPLDSSAAGHNLTNVAKVLFVSPLLVGNANAINGFYKQAIGRARRFGQRSDVEVIHYLTLNTIEIGIFKKFTGGHQEMRQLLKLVSGANDSDGSAGSRMVTD